jgi:hypothetical protein
MSDHNMQPNETEEPQQTKSETAGQQTQQNQMSTNAQPTQTDQHKTPGRRPLFGN